jgi:hypothetical protein
MPSSASGRRRAPARSTGRSAARAAVAQSLPEFLATAGTLTIDDRKLVVDQALILLEQNYAHLPLKMAMHAVNPVQRLRVLRTRLDHQVDSALDPEWQFHAEMSSIFHSVRDLHTNYLLPAPFAGKIAYLPFAVEKANDHGVDRYLITRIATDWSADHVEPGVEVTHWNGTPIATAVAINGALFAGSNQAANLARGLESLTIRPLVIQLPPVEDWVTVSFVGLDGVARELRESWRVVENLPPMTDPNEMSAAAAAMGVDLDSDEKSRANKLLFVPDVVRAEGGTSSAQLRRPTAVGDADLPTTMPGVFRARSVITSAGTFGHLRIFTFSVQDGVAFRDEFVRLAAALPQNGLIVDVRDNGGGLIYASEFTLQTMTPRPIAPEPVQFLATPLNLRICKRHQDNPAGIDLGPWFGSLDQALETGSSFSAARPISPLDGANDLGQTYHGPVVLVTDARCYSATDIFAAGFADHRIGPILGVDDNTGAGGANVWTQGLLKQLLEVPTPVDPDSPYRTLPAGVNMRVAIRRTTRVGELSGTPVEDLGVLPDAVHRLTTDDLLHGNVDLLEAAGAILAALPVRRLQIAVTRSGAAATAVYDTDGVDRLDLYLDGRPLLSEGVDAAGALTVELTDVAEGQRLRTEGFASGELVAARQVLL